MVKNRQKKQKTKAAKMYSVRVDGCEVAMRNTEKAAWKYAQSYYESCLNQDIPYYPKIEIVELTLADESEVFDEQKDRKSGNCSGI